ncbi:hypothetical protein ABH977_008248 [Bradyrhizobium ottawaense]
MASMDNFRWLRWLRSYSREERTLIIIYCNNYDDIVRFSVEHNAPLAF